MVCYTTDNHRRANLKIAKKEGVDYGSNNCPICGSTDFTPSKDQKPAHCNSCEIDKIEYQNFVGYREVDSYGNCEFWEPHVYSSQYLGYKHCELAQERGVNWSCAEASGWCKDHRKKSGQYPEK